MAAVTALSPIHAAAHHGTPRPEAVRVDAITERTVKWQALSSLLAGHRAKFERVIALADDAPAGINASILAELANKARGGLRQIAATEANPILDGSFGSLGQWNQNGRGPAVDDLLRSAEFHAARAADAARKVA